MFLFICLFATHLFIFRQMIADACCAIAQRTFQRDLHKVWMSHGVPLPPQDIFELKATLRNEVFNVLYPGKLFFFHVFQS